MATRAERFRYVAERSKPPRPKSPRPPGPPTRGVSTARRNLSLARGAVYAFEDSQAPALPSRKSTRRSKNRQKAGASLKSRQQLELASPRARHQSAAVRAPSKPRR